MNKVTVHVIQHKYICLHLYTQTCGYIATYLNIYISFQSFQLVNYTSHIISWLGSIYVASSNICAVYAYLLKCLCNIPTKF